MKNKATKDSSSFTRIFTVFRKVDMEIEEWVLHFINQIENEKQNQSAQE